MNPQTTAKQTVKPQKAPSTKPSITGGIFSVLALISAGIAYFFTHIKLSTDPSLNSSQKVAETVGNGTVEGLAALFSMFFIVGTVVFALIAIVFSLLRITKIKTVGWIFTILWIALSIWSVVIISGALEVLKANPTNQL